MPEETPTQDNKIMDIQSPQPTTTVPADNSVPTVEPVVPPQTEAVAAPVEAEQPAATQESTPEPDPALAPETPNPLAPQLGDKTPHHRSAPIGAIIAAVVVVLALTGLTVFALKGYNKPTISTPAVTTDTEVKPADIDQTTQDIDSSLQDMNDTEDLNSEDLSDATLGL